MFECPLCGYYGPFRTSDRDTVRFNAICVACGSLERHRLMWLVVQQLKKQHDLTSMRILHFAPERCCRGILKALFRKYETADINAKHVTYHVDMCKLPFRDESFDFLIASHVLHHIADEEMAMRELRRILRPGGIAVIPSPIFSATTVEYPAPLDGQFRAPGLDYFERCRTMFGSVNLYSSESFDKRYQIWLSEDRMKWPARLSGRPRSPGT